MAQAQPPRVRRSRPERKSFTPNQETAMGDSFAARVNASHRVDGSSSNAHHTMIYHHMTITALELNHMKEKRQAPEAQVVRPTERDMLGFLASLNPKVKPAVVEASAPVVEPAPKKEDVVMAPAVVSAAAAAGTAASTVAEALAEVEEGNTPKSTVKAVPLSFLMNSDLHSDDDDDGMEDLSNIPWVDDVRAH